VPQDDLATVAAGHLQRPGLVVIAGPPGAGRSSVLRRLAAAAPGPVYTGGGLAMLTSVPALALSRAVRARLPAHDVALLAEAVRSRVRSGLLILDDLQYADQATCAALPYLAGHCRVAVALRTPHRLPAEALRAAATAWLQVPPLPRPEALELARRSAPQLTDAALNAVLDRAGGNPLAVAALARHAATGRGAPGGDIDQVAYAIATALADLPRPARTALAALGLLGRPAPAALLGAGGADLVDTGLATLTDGGLLPVSTYLAETAAGLLDTAARTDLHLRLAELTPPAEAAKHLSAAGDQVGAYRRALAAADRAAGGDRAALLLFACDRPGVQVDPRVRIAAADAALTAGRPLAAARVLSTPGPLGVEADVLRGEALLQAGEPRAAREAVAPVPDAAPAPVVAARDRVLLLAGLSLDPAAAGEAADKITVRYPRPPAGLAAALAAVRARQRAPGWAAALAAAAADTADPLTGRWSAWLLVEQLSADGRLTESAAVARAAARSCATDLAYSWQTRFAAAAHWAEALHGGLVERLDAGSPAAGWSVAGWPVRPPEEITDPAGEAGPGLEDLQSPGSAPGDHAGGASSGPGAFGWPTGDIVADPASEVGPAPGARRWATGDIANPVSDAGSGSTSLQPASEAGPGLGAHRWPAADIVADPAGGAGPGPGAHRWPVQSADIGADPAGGAGPGHRGLSSGDYPRSGADPGSQSPGWASRPATDSVADHTAGGLQPADLASGGHRAGVEPIGPDAVQRRAADLTDRSLPAAARGYATAATALVEADTGLLAAARARLSDAAAHPATAWVAREAAWLDGQPDRATTGLDDAGEDLLTGLHHITARWAAHDLNAAGPAAIPAGLPAAARRTLTAWATGTGFTAAADTWTGTALRERVRCLLAAGILDPDPGRAVEALLAAEQLADGAGLTVLAGRARRALRRHRIHRDTRSPRSGTQLTRRETDVLRLVAAGEPTRRIAGQLGISAETVDTHIRAGMRKLGARTRTEAAALAFADADSYREDSR